MLHAIQDAYARIKSDLYPTPLIRSYHLEPYFGCAVYLKLENLQRTGAFKMRGALNKFSVLSDDAIKGGMVAASSGNHGRAIAYVCKSKGVPCTIVMPQTAPPIKVANILALGADVVQCPTENRFKVAAQVAEERGAIVVPPFDDNDVMIGQGTIGLELMEQAPELTHILVPVGGGGLVGGIAAAVKGLSDHTKVYGVEPEILPRYTESLKAGKPVAVPQNHSIADALASQQPGDVNFPVVQNYVDGMLTVSETAIQKAHKLMITEGKIFCEASSSIGLGAVLEEKITFTATDRVCLVISGGNLSLDQLSSLIDIEI
ncbi:threonine/serine dehydratase [Peptoniphilus equinus]|uniref:Threonine/serine dehydratase n=1 Tax=Peptoniphilus equinus TaxID=3016343 RepID=A0ABY7QVC9_9FIRM|nr:threonine/serine dehydratase [Peptoniphilus equinus]WBW50296.1 threonine/serine dehydratase [Peptoniphilus equinus]